MECCGIALKDNLANRRLKLKGLPEIAAPELPQVVCVLRMKRQIQSKHVTQLRQLSRGRAFSQHLLDRIPGHDVNHEENEDENQPKRRQCEEKPFEKVTGHRHRKAMNSPETVSNLSTVAARPPVPAASCSRFERGECAEFLLLQRAFRPFQRPRIVNRHTQSFLLPWG